MSNFEYLEVPSRVVLGRWGLGGWVSRSHSKGRINENRTEEKKEKGLSPFKNSFFNNINNKTITFRLSNPLLMVTFLLNNVIV